MVQIDKFETPAGGDTAVAYFWDADGNPCTADRAVSGEIVEYLGGVEIQRTHWDPEAVPPEQPSYLDVENTDVTKGTWDLWCPEPGGALVLIEHLEQLQRVWAAPETFDRDLSTLMVLPVWDAAPATLRREANDYLVSLRT